MHARLLLLSLAAALVLTPAARAHKLEGEHKVLPGNKVLIESWFETGEFAVGAKVRVTRDDGTLLFPEPGELDEKGAFTFSYDKPERLRVEISAGQGHRKYLLISAAELRGGPSEAREAPPREYELPIKELLLGVTFLMSGAALYLSVRNSLRLAELSRHRGER